MRFVGAAVATLALVILAGGTNAAGDKKIEIKDVMKTAMKGGLCGKCASGKASDEEKKKLVELFTALCKDTPPKGDADSWKMKTEALLSAAKKVADGDASAGKTLKMAADCMACHKAHK